MALSENSFFKRLFSKAEDDKEKKTFSFKNLIVVILILVVLVIFLSTIFPKKKSSSESGLNGLSNSFKSLEYCEAVENRLECVLKNIEGVGKVEVFVMVDSSPTIKYLMESNSTTNQNGESGSTSVQTTVYEARNGSIYSPVVEVEILPKIIGVLIVATGAKDSMLKATLTNIVSNVLSVNISNVEVVEGK